MWRSAKSESRSPKPSSFYAPLAPWDSPPGFSTNENRAFSIRFRPVNLKKYLRARQKVIDRALDRYLPKTSTKPVTLHKAMRYSLFAGGKRLRPILCLAAAEACRGNVDTALPL